MNANPQFLATAAHVDEAAVKPLPNSRKFYVPGLASRYPRADARDLPGRSTHTNAGEELNPPIYVYDCSGPYTDPAVENRHPLRPGRDARTAGSPSATTPSRWRNSPPNMAGNVCTIRNWPTCASTSRIRRARPKPGKNVTQMHYARQGIITPEMEYIAIRENQKIDGLSEMLLTQHHGENFGKAMPKKITPEFVRDEVAAGRAVITGQHQPSRSRADDHRPQLSGEDQRQHRQLRARLQHPGRSREDDLGHPLGRRHGDGSCLPARHIHETREWIIRNSPVPIGTVPIYQALEKVNGNAEDLTWEIFKDTLIEQAEQGVDYFTIHAGRAAALHPDDREPHDRHRVARRFHHGEVVPGAPQGEFPLHAFRGNLRNHESLRRDLLPGRRSASRLDLRRQRRSATRRTEDTGRTHPDRVEARRASHDRRPRPCADAHDQGEHGHAAEAGATKRRSTRLAR